MLLFITSEVMFFAGLFAAYFNVRANFVAVDRRATLAAARVRRLAHILPYVGPATILLIASSFTCQFAVWAIRRDDRTAFIRNMAVTVTLGIIFLTIQAIDYVVLGSKGLTLSSGTFGTTYYTLTGFHGAHVFGGVIMLGVVLYRGMAGQFSAKHHDAVEATSLYWHFVDVVWILLFSLLYLLPGT
jgi:cytochrome c oxidase subunit III